MGVTKIEVISDPVLGEEVANQAALTGLSDDVETIDSRVDALETAVGILEEGGQLMQGSYILGRWTPVPESSMLFGRWTPITAS